MILPSAAGEFDHIDGELVVTFVDLAGYTAFTEAHGDHQAAQLAEVFAATAKDCLGPGDELVKTIGDAVMVASESVSAAVAFIRRLNERTRRSGGFPLLRAGLSAGPVVKRSGDVYGATVNTAARLASISQPGQIVADRNVLARV